MNELRNALDVDVKLTVLQAGLLIVLLIAAVLYCRALLHALPVVWRSTRGAARVMWIAIAVLVPFVGARLAVRRAKQPHTLAS